MLKLNELLYILSYHSIVTALALGVTAGFLQSEAPTVAKALAQSTSIFVIVSLMLHRLSKHPEKIFDSSKVES